MQTFPTFSATVPADIPGAYSEMIFTGDLSEITRQRTEPYYLLMLILAGSIEMRIGKRPFSAAASMLVVALPTENISIIRRTDGFAFNGILLSDRYTLLELPQNSTLQTSALRFAEQPILTLTDHQFGLIGRDMGSLHERFVSSDHRFRRQVMDCACQTLFYDLLHISSQGEQTSGNEASRPHQLFSKFIALLARGDCRDHRNLDYYASELCISPLYLTEICTRVSGHPTTYWIDRYTMLEIMRRLADHHLSITDISMQLNFHSLSYFCSYVKTRAGLSPNQIRKNLS